MKIFVSIPRNSEVMKTFIPDDVKRYLEENFEVAYSPFDRQITRGEIPLYANDSDVILTGWGHPALDDEVLEKTAIKLIAHTGGSVGSLVNQNIYEKGIRVISGNNLYADSVAEGVLAYMLTSLRNIPDYVNMMRNGGWKRGDNYTEGLLDQTVGIVGMGAISSRLIKLLQLFNVKIKVFSHYPIPEECVDKYHVIPTSLEDIFATCKIITLHSAMNERNRGLIGKEHFNLLQDGAVFINTARGGIVKEEEMIDALKKKHFKAVLDVYCQEPLSKESELRRLENVYCIPHLAGPTVDRRPVITRCLVDNILKFENGKEMELEISREYAKRMTVGG